LFDYIQAEIPVLVTEIVEIEKIIEKYKIGFILHEELTASFLADKISEIRSNYSDQIDELKLNLKKAKSIENWDVELEKLKEIYANLN
jgi:glycosyltransferase involved in cell wall biosynthesis